MSLYNLVENTTYSLNEENDLFLVSGMDAERFLSGQLTNNISILENHRFQLQARLDRGGKLKAFFYLLKAEKDFYLLVSKEFSKNLIEDLNKYIIMDDVEIGLAEQKVWLLFTSYEDPASEYNLTSHFKGAYGFYPTVLTFCEPKHAKRMDKEQFKKISLMQGEPVINITAKLDTLVTDTIVNLTGVSLEKGCFLGQETVSKIETRRGGAYFPVSLKLSKEDYDKVESQNILKIEDRKVGEVIWKGTFNDDQIILASLIRDYRVDKRKLVLNCNEIEIKAEVNYLPYFPAFLKKDLVDDLYEKAVKTFHQNKEEEAVSQFEEILKIDPLNEDSFEAIGVIFGRMEKYVEGITFMDKVLSANPDSVMAHTNKSLFYMRMGEIEKAEEEKAQATVKSFGSFGKEAEKKRKEEEFKKQELAEIERRFDMFNQVLEIDPEDSLANYGLADIFFQRGEPIKSIPLLEKVLSENEKYSVGYLLLGKCYLELDQLDQAREVFEKGISIASTQGDLMPANEMQAKLTALS